ncbi:lactoylglutathione lyase [Sphaeroforma arctica JP610]|uniref:Lactoylglutathione lyase n=1 Tax=Sphaeroforma arctica JP610 TaxID=667725 RepID=A0A0L0GGA3_9EUKA|nr:lactoylglutathione lyase [Sphaeroforma arctica JP610]KNC87871.1 lactoylglutathione lyase [Sphaeroforma arctica JP610]|eukprot:XP_014161773.1 lactoylglutathione lyase [Sphaeroforma arctica JP610]
MVNSIANVALVVKDYDEAKDFYINKLGFTLVEDTTLSPEKRWVVIRPRGAEANTSTCLLLAKAVGDEQLACVGNQAGGRVMLFLNTDNFWEDYHEMKEKGVEFLEEPRVESYATVVVFKDLYGNKWDFIQRK